MPVVIWSGPSELDGCPIVLLAPDPTRLSQNIKTGPMLQTYILRPDLLPTAAIKNGADASICGDCRHRGTFGKNRTCYVNVGQSVNSIWYAFTRATLRGESVVLTPGERVKLGAGRSIRAGAYGDPAAVPVQIWLDLLTNADSNTGYTHQWRTCDPAFKDFCMASVDSEAEAEEARSYGWRTFRVMNDYAELMENEVECPNSTTGIQCVKCKHCNGTDPKRSSSVAIYVHGTAANRIAFNQAAA